MFGVEVVARGAPVEEGLQGGGLAMGIWQLKYLQLQLFILPTEPEVLAVALGERLEDLSQRNFIGTPQ